jgi:hypothetical protein
MASQTQNGIWGFLGGVLFAGFMWFYFYCPSNHAAFERLDKTRLSSFKADVGLGGVEETKAPQGLVNGTPNDRIANGRSQSSLASIPLSSGEKRDDEHYAPVNNTVRTKPPVGMKVSVEVSGLHLPATKSSTSAGTKDDAENVDGISAAAVTNKDTCKVIRQHLGRDGEWKAIDEDPENDKFEFLILRREYARFDIPRIRTVVEVKDSGLKQVLKRCLPPEQAIFEDELV